MPILDAINCILKNPGIISLLLNLINKKESNKTRRFITLKMQQSHITQTPKFSPFFTFVQYFNQFLTKHCERAKSYFQIKGT